MRNVFLTSAIAAMALGTAVSLAHAGPITGVSTSTNGAFTYKGLGADGTGRGTGLYTLGNCSNDGTNSTCLFTGMYTESTGTNPGATGSFTLTTTYAGTSPFAPSIARSVSTVDPNTVGFIDANLNGALMTLALSPSYGGLFVATLPPFPPTGMGFSAFLAPGATCTGAPATCSIGDVGLTLDAVLTGTIRAERVQLLVTAEHAEHPRTGDDAAHGGGAERGRHCGCALVAETQHIHPARRRVQFARRPDPDESGRRATL